jgi:hypothetical protein
VFDDDDDLAQLLHRQVRVCSYLVVVPGTMNPEHLAGNSGRSATVNTFAVLPAGGSLKASRSHGTDFKQQHQNLHFEARILAGRSGASSVVSFSGLSGVCSQFIAARGTGHQRAASRSGLHSAKLYHRGKGRRWAVHAVSQLTGRPPDISAAS